MAWKLSYGLVRGYTPIIAYQQAIGLEQQTGQLSRKRCLFLLDSSLWTQKKKSARSTMLTDFLYSDVFR